VSKETGSDIPGPDAPEVELVDGVLEYTLPPVRDGEWELQCVIESAGKPWLLGLGVVYDDLIAQLGDDKTFGPFVHEIRARWETRVAAKRWPKFLAR
jgi:hypothetical protein